MAASASLDDSSDISSNNASNTEEKSEFEYSDSDATDEEEYDDQSRQLPRAQTTKRGLRTRGGVRNVIGTRIANQPVSGVTQHQMWVS